MSDKVGIWGMASMTHSATHQLGFISLNWNSDVRVTQDSQTSTSIIETLHSEFS